MEILLQQRFIIWSTFIKMREREYYCTYTDKKTCENYQHVNEHSGEGEDQKPSTTNYIYDCDRNDSYTHIYNSHNEKNLLRQMFQIDHIKRVGMLTYLKSGNLIYSSHSNFVKAAQELKLYRTTLMPVICWANIITQDTIKGD